VNEQSAAAPAEVARRPLAVVTGASAGIGEAIASRLAEAGFDLILGARRQDRLREVADRLGAEARPLARSDSWRWMWEVNVLGLMQMTRALLPALEASGRGHIVNVSSTAGFEVYEGGGGYTSAKHGVHAISQTLRLELAGRPIRVTEISPGMVETDFSLNRFEGDAVRAAGVYQGVTPLTAADVADVVAFAITRPAHVNLDEIVMRPLQQAAAHKVVRRS
jgi:hypothetical protein